MPATLVTPVVNLLAGMLLTYREVNAHG